MTFTSVKSRYWALVAQNIERQPFHGNAPEPKAAKVQDVSVHLIWLEVIGSMSVIVAGKPESIARLQFLTYLRPGSFRPAEWGVDCHRHSKQVLA